jgi:hypothetical protein
MKRKMLSVCIFAILLTLAMACSRRSSLQPQLRVEIPAGFTGNFVLDMGIRGASPLPKDGDVYVVTVSRTGKVETSTLLDKPNVTFKNATNGQIWGYSHRLFTTGDGISTGAKIEFFVGTQKDFDAEQNKKNKSGGFFKSDWILAHS